MKYDYKDIEFFDEFIEHFNRFFEPFVRKNLFLKV